MDIAIKYEKIDLWDGMYIFKASSIIYGEYDEETDLFETGSYVFKIFFAFLTLEISAISFCFMAFTSSIFCFSSSTSFNLYWFNSLFCLILSNLGFSKKIICLKSDSFC